MLDLDLEGVHVLISGANGGIGQLFDLHARIRCPSSDANPVILQGYPRASSSSVSAQPRSARLLSSSPVHFTFSLSLSDDTAEQGAKVTAQYNSTSRKLDADAELQAYGAKGAYQALQADVADEKAVDDLFDRAEKGMQGDIVKVLVGESSKTPHPPSP